MTLEEFRIKTKGMPPGADLFAEDENGKLYFVKDFELEEESNIIVFNVVED
jgi:hypothetical protein